MTIAITIHRLTSRPQFLAAAKGVSQARGAVVVQRFDRADGDATMRIGFTATRKVGGAVARNRCKRRLREAARALVGQHGVPGSDYVFIARQGIEGKVEGETLTLGLRPEKVMLHSTPPEGPNVIAGEVKDLAYFGKDSLYRVILPGGALMSVHAVNARRMGDARPDWNDQVWLSFEPSAAILLRN